MNPRDWLIKRIDWESRKVNDPENKKIPHTEVEKLFKLRLMKIEKQVCFFGWFIIYTILVGFEAPPSVRYGVAFITIWNFIDFCLCNEVVKEHEKEFK